MYTLHMSSIYVEHIMYTYVEHIIMEWGVRLQQRNNNNTTTGAAVVVSVDRVAVRAIIIEA